MSDPKTWESYEPRTPKARLGRSQQLLQVKIDVQKKMKFGADSTKPISLLDHQLIFYHLTASAHALNDSNDCTVHQIGSFEFEIPIISDRRWIGGQSQLFFETP